jgi:hypothetical protein
VGGVDAVDAGDAKVRVFACRSEARADLGSNRPADYIYARAPRRAIIA